MRMKHLPPMIPLLIMLLTLSAPSPPITCATTRVQADWGQMPLYFVANQGQVDERVAYYIQGSDKTLYFTSEGITFALTDLTADLSQKGERQKGRWIVKLDFVDANPAHPTGQNQTDAIISYFKGSPGEWHTELPTYSRIVYRDLWEGIDLMYNGTVNRLKYEFVIRPGADPARIRLAYRGATARLNDVGQLEVSTPAGNFHDEAPVAYQEVDGERVPVTASYAPGDATTYGFRLGAYDPTLPLVIDPAVLVYCGYIGGNGWEDGEGIAVDAAGNAYVVGDTDSTQTTFPETVGPDLTHNGGVDVFVAKIRADGAGLVYAGYIGGSGDEYSRGIAVDAAGNAYVTGETNSTQATFPVTIGPDLTYNGGARDAFVAKVKADGTGLLYAGYIGGSGEDYGKQIAVDGSGNAYVTGGTYSTQATFPVTVGPDLTHNGSSDAFVAKVKADGTGLVYAGYIGGSGWERGHGIAVDVAGNAYVTGETYSTQATFPVTVGPGLAYNGNADAYVAKVKADGTGFVYVGYIGGSNDDFGTSIAVDASGYAYVVGDTYSNQATFPVLVGPDLTHNGDTDVFVAKVKADGAGLVYAGYIGGSDWEEGWGIAVDTAGNVYIGGSTESTEGTFPVAVGPDLTYNGDGDTFVAKVKPNGTSLVYCGYIGGSGWEEAWDIAIDTAGNAYLVGSTNSTADTFPVTIGPDLTPNWGPYDAFVAKVPVLDLRLYLPLVLK